MSCTPTSKHWDVFISHASEDKAFVSDLVRCLERRKLSLWVDYKVLLPGDSILRRIEEGLSRSSFGVLVLSEPFFSKTWTGREMEAMIGLYMDREDRLIPLWHGVDEPAVRAYSPLLVTRLAIRTAPGVAMVAKEISRKIRLSRASSSEEAQMEFLAEEYNEIRDADDDTRLPKKFDVLGRMKSISRAIKRLDQFTRRNSEGDRLAIAAVLQVAPRRTELSRLISACRQTKHRFVWVEICAAIVRHAESFRFADRERALAHAEMSALVHRPVCKDSRSAHEALQKALAAITSAVSSR